MDHNSVQNLFQNTSQNVFRLKNRNGYSNNNNNRENNYKFKNNFKPKFESDNTENGINDTKNDFNHENVYIKQQLINYIYSTVELSNFNYKLLEYEADLNLLTKDKYFVSANYSGSNCLLIFVKIKERFFSYLVDRKTLTYNKNSINLDNIKIIPVNIKLDESIY